MLMLSPPKKKYIYNNVRARKKSTTILKYARKIYKNLLKSKKKCIFAAEKNVAL